MKKYWKEFIIPYYDTDAEGYIKVENILLYMAETSSWHSDSLGVGVGKLSKKNYAWMLNNWEVEIFKFPKVKETVSIGTWASKLDRFFATREFAMVNTDGDIIAKASTKWFFIDIKRRRPIRIPVEIHKKYSCIEEFNLTEDSNIGKFSCDMIESRPVVVRKSDIDNNNHVNNIRYIEWMQEGFDSDIINDLRIYKLGIVYKKEILLGDTIISKYCENKNINGRFEHVISVNNKQNALGYTQWKEKKLLVEP